MSFNDLISALDKAEQCLKNIGKIIDAEEKKKAAKKEDPNTPMSESSETEKN